VGAELKLLVVINSLDSGGAEKSALKLAQGLHQDGNEVALLTFTSDQDFYEPLSQFPRITLDTGVKEYRRVSHRSLVPRRVFFWIDQMFKLIRLRRIITHNKPDCVISISASVSVFVYIATLFLKTPQIGSERINPDKKVFSHGKIVDRMRPFIYRHGVILSVQTRGVQDWCKVSWACDSIITPNHLNLHPIKSNFDKDFENFKIPHDGLVLAIGRDHPQKNFDFLLQAWRQYEIIGGSRELKIIGPANPTRLNLVIEQLGIRNAQIIPRTPELSSFYKKAKVLVSTSRFEGFPNVILEALSFGIPVISTPSCDLIHEFESKGCCVLFEGSSAVEYAKLIKNTEENLSLIQKMSQSALEVSHSYAWQNVRNSWYECINHAITKQQG
jgi:GalNAc-alpha-(1->4)-GalNAc-alpha-(1->3)-diNAcBac-PP-undecaprenol alpha-1,4-N-acetyl-D-galactosaminyltransferase